VDGTASWNDWRSFDFAQDDTLIERLTWQVRLPLSPSYPLSPPRIRDKLHVMHAPRPTVPLARLSPGYHPDRSDRWPWEIGRGWVWLGAFIIAALIWFGIPAFFRWPHVISSSGGHYFLHRTVIPVDPFAQDDPRWGDQLLGNTIDTLGQQGCAVTSAAMVLHAYGVDTDPQRLNAFLTTHGGFVGDGLIVWDNASLVAGGQVQKAYEDLPSYDLIDANILKGNPVIVRLRLRNGTTHFVVIVGKQGWNYLIRDPARDPDYGVYPLSNLTGRIQALRFYTIVPPPPVLKVRPAPLAVQPSVATPRAPAPIVPALMGPPVPTTMSVTTATTNTAFPLFPPSTPVAPPDHAP
jgi:hypothetical protein